MNRIGFGGSCHWCTEAIFLSLKGVITVDQGWVASDDDASGFSEAVIVEFNQQLLSLPELIAVHLYTHSCTATHPMRSKYRSAVYTFDDSQSPVARQAIEDLQKEFNDRIITQILPFRIFKLSHERYRNYYYKDPAKPFCLHTIQPKLQLLLQLFPDLADMTKSG